ncbi:uncharacterized protein LOC135144298 [Zophobas morio]|uniref:uncharacterized protein LOC135144298 n=1 Tax=Zophobas morio TaxID=2755281 RepID=UPI003083ACA1
MYLPENYFRKSDCWIAFLANMINFVVISFLILKQALNRKKSHVRGNKTYDLGGRPSMLLTAELPQQFSILGGNRRTWLATVDTTQAPGTLTSDRTVKYPEY